MTAIGDYFRTALLIDDRVEPDYSSSEDVEISEDDATPIEPGPGLVPSRAPDETPVHPSKLVEAFLAEGVVCSVVEARKQDTGLASMALTGALIADLLILDWLLFGDDLDTVGMIKRVAERNAERLRVIVVFTGAPSLSDVSARLVEDAGFEERDDFVLKRNNVFVLVFGKPESSRVRGEAQRRPSTYGDLPSMIRQDLEKVFKGLMPEFAFRGINALREAAPRILATFNSDLDAAALVHRALIPESADAGPQFVKLLVSEFEQALHDERVAEVWEPETVSSHLENTEQGGAPGGLAKKLKSNLKVPDDLKTLGDSELCREAIVRGLSNIGVADRSASNVVGDLSDAVGSSDGSNGSLAALMSSSGLGETPPRLEMGVVLREGDERYWLCIQPLCDSVRLRTRRAFPMLPLDIKPQKTAAMIRSPEGALIPIGFDSRPHNLAMPEFQPADAGSVVAYGEPSNWRFTSEDDVEYQAIARLRPELAAQAVHGLASAASRAGANVSEWMRRGAKSQGPSRDEKP